MSIRLRISEIFARHPEDFPITTYFLGTFSKKDCDLKDALAKDALAKDASGRAIEWIKNLDEEIFDAMVMKCSKFVSRKWVVFPYDLVDFIYFIKELAITIYGEEDAKNSGVAFGAVVDLVQSQIMERMGNDVEQLF